MDSNKKKDESVETETSMKKVLLPILGAGLALGGILKGLPSTKGYKLRSVKDAVARSRGQASGSVDRVKA